VSSTRHLAAIAVVAALAVTACGGNAASSDADTSAPLKIGLVLPATGTLTPNGKGNKDGFDFYFAQHQNTVAGRPVQLIDADDEGKPDVAVAKVQELVERENVDVIAGFVSSAAALAARDLAVRTKTPLVVTQAATSKLTADESGLVSRVISTFEVTMSALTKSATTDDGRRRIVFMGSDYEAGKDAERAVRTAAEGSRASVVASVFAPLGTQDFAPFLSNIPADTDAVVAFFGGNDAVRFVQQYSDFGLKRLPLYGHWSLTVDPLLAQEGAAAEGIVTVQEYSRTLDNPASTAFVKAWADAKGSPPNAWNEQGYVAAMAIAAGAEAAPGATGAELATAIRASKLDAPRGAVTFDDHGQVQQQLYIASVAPDSAGMVNTLVPNRSVG
jgi:branched-chain amino acid transport system substrate-binding protein